MQIKNLNGTNLIFISDIDITTSDNISVISVCVTEIVGKDVAPTYMCQNVSSSNSVNLTAPNEIVKITISYIVEDGGINFIDLFNGIIDQGNFISSDGIFFGNNENKCFKSSTANLNTTFCCTSSSQNTQAPVYLPKCTNFKISSTFYNTTNDNIYTSATSEFSLSDSDLISNGYYIGDIPTLYSINNYIFQSINEKYDSIFVGRIILLEGQTFLVQGIPLTAANNCLNVTSPYHDIDKQQGIDVVSELCCIAFSGIYVTTTSLPATMQSSVSASGTSPKPGATSTSTTLKPLATDSTFIPMNSSISGSTVTSLSPLTTNSALPPFDF
uniref:Uncharacterized protein n=1 Tax=Panagrolaimus davidi TaxID=227884 RepID=A0A914P8R5_9BILA